MQKREKWLQMRCQIIKQEIFQEKEIRIQFLHKTEPIHFLQYLNIQEILLGLENLELL